MPTGGTGWLVLGLAESRALLTDPRLIKGGWNATPLADRLPEEVARGIHTSMLNVDPPAHTRLRKLVTSAFTRRRVERLIPKIQQTTDALLTAADGTEPVDLISALAYPLPFNVICDLIGIPEEDRADFRAWTPPAISPGMFSFEEYRVAVTSMLEYSRSLIRSKRKAPQDDLLSDLIAARDHDDSLTEDELTSMIYILLLAGHETTVNLIGNGAHTLLTHPDQLALLRERPELLEDAVEELLRFDGPVQNSPPYRATEAIEVGGVTLPEGAVVHFAVMAANRDRNQIPGPDVLDFTRKGQPSHIAFGHGIHHCLGAPLARLEGRIALGSLIERFPKVRLAAPDRTLTRLPSLILHGWSELPVLLQ
ncbi:cytochrome P450 family protein [Streptomyces sp. NPDC002159]